MIEKLKCDIVKSDKYSEKAVVAIHGWQGNSKSMYPIMKSMNIQNSWWYFPQAPYPVGKNGDAWSWSYEISEGVWEIEEPKRLLEDFFSKLFTKFTSKNVYVMGFSQGGLVCLDFVLFFNKSLGGVFSIAGFLRQPKAIIERFHPSQKKTPILISHGRNDDQVPARASENAYQLLKKRGANVELHLYNGKHKIGIESIRKIREIIQS